MSNEAIKPVTDSLVEIKLTGDRVARVGEPKGLHIRQARRMQQEAGIDYIFALIAQLTTIDGQAIVPHDLDDLPGRDVVKLTETVQGKMA
nr:hypothetical protein [uncultured Pseudogulbenkiania sp.]